MGDAALAPKQSTLVAAAGEYHVLARLCLTGKLAAQAPRGVPNADIVVSSIHGDKLCAVQVKTRSGKGSDGGWHMRRKHELLVGPKLVYCFVDFDSDFQKSPVIYIVPSEVVATVLRLMHQAWLDRPGIKGQKHNDSDFRRFVPDYSVHCGEQAKPYIDGWLEKYKEAWHLLPS